MLVFAMSSLSVGWASSIAQGFESGDPNIAEGALVSLKEDRANTVELADTVNLDRLVGVAGSNSLIELNDANGVVQVVTSGETQTLVSDINGDVRTGDKITASPLAGVGMRALNSTLVIGTAQVDLDDSAETRNIKDKSGRDQTVSIGLIPVLVDKVFYQAPQDQNTFLPPALQDFANNLAGRPVSPVRVMIAGLLVVFLFVAVAALLYSAVRSSIISIGRNPLSQSAVRKSLLQVGLTVFGVMAFTIIIVYFILTL
jgi:hypothetical protein